MGRARSKKVSYSRDLPTLSMFSMAQALACSTTPTLLSSSREKMMNFEPGFLPEMLTCEAMLAQESPAQPLPFRSFVLTYSQGLLAPNYCLCHDLPVYDHLAVHHARD